MDEVQETVGLDYLDDEALAVIASQKNSDGEMTYEACIAFRELARRSGHDV